MKPFARRYTWTPTLTAELRRAYALAGVAKSSAIGALQAHTQWPRSAIVNEARRLGLSRARRWDAAEVVMISRQAGEIDSSGLAKRLKRSPESVRMRAKRLGVSVRVRADYSLDDVRGIFGVGMKRLRGWIERDLLGRVVQTTAGQRIRDAALVHFIAAHMDEYSFRVADETFLKGVLLNGTREGIPGEAHACVACRGKEARAGSRRSA